MSSFWYKCLADDFEALEKKVRLGRGASLTNQPEKGVETDTYTQLDRDGSQPN